MFQVNGHSLVDASHRLAVEVLKSAGNDIVVVVSRPQSSQHDKYDQPSVTVPRDRFMTNSQPLPAVTLSPSKTQPSKSAERVLNLPEPLDTYAASKTASLVKLGDQQSPEKRYESKEYLTVVDGQTNLSSLSHCAVSADIQLQNSSLHRILGSVRHSSSNARQQGDRDACHGTVSLRTSVNQEDSKPQEQVC